MDNFLHQCSTGFVKGLGWGVALTLMLVLYLWSPAALLGLALTGWALAALMHGTRSKR